MTHPSYHHVDVDGLDVFYRQAGDPSKPTLLLLHGFPTSSHMFRDLIPHLATHFHLIAPDLPGFGRSAMPERASFDYRFEHLAQVIGRFTEVLGLTRFGLYIFDYGAPVGLRVALAHPDKISAIISQNGNAYREGLSSAWAPLQRYWDDPSDGHRQTLRELLTPAMIRWQYEHGVADRDAISPDGIALDLHYLQRAEADEVQLDLMLDYASNIARYPDFHAYFRKYQPNLLAIWGRHDPFFIPAGAEAYRRDLPQADIRLLDSGHFALETHAAEIAQAIIEFWTSKTS